MFPACRRETLSVHTIAQTKPENDSELNDCIWEEATTKENPFSSEGGDDRESPYLTTTITRQ